MINKLKNWWLEGIAFFAVILDQGFEIVKPLLVEIGMPSKAMGYVRIAFALYGIYLIKKRLPTTNTEKLKEIVKNKVADDIGGGVGKNDPPPK